MLEKTDREIEKERIANYILNNGNIKFKPKVWISAESIKKCAIFGKGNHKYYLVPVDEVE